MGDGNGDLQGISTEGWHEGTARLEGYDTGNGDEGEDRQATIGGFI